MPTELYRKYRPKKLEDVLGQPEAVGILTEKLSNGGFPHAVLFSGQKGCGKTTMARIVARRLGCSRADFHEVNAADKRGLDDVRKMVSNIGYAPIGGKCRVWLCDEVHHWSRREGADAQTALLTTFEELPAHVYFLLCTTDPDALRPTLRDRCLHVRVQPLPEPELDALLRRVLKAEGKAVGKDVLAEIVSQAEGGARAALQLLDRVIGLPDDAARLAALARGDVKRTVDELLKTLLWGKGDWRKVSEIIRSLDDSDWEGLRRRILAAAAGTVLSGKGDPRRAALVLEEFEKNWFDSGRAGLVLSCLRVLHAEK